ncbi:MAG: tRNA pseudouridine(38-40) synthase TruA [Proteobacteria bacterium]|nr:tRNA pseudouridine(38-40) synthase TruA [Pseudomonadota bacterium]
MTQRWKLTIEYDGTDFVGWQVQENGISVQGCLEKAVHDFCGEKVTLHVAGRTDSGVHAIGQVAHMDLARPSTEKEVRDALNADLRPCRVSIVRAEPVSQNFHARFGALNRIYCYKILMNRWAPPALAAPYVWHVGWDLNVEAMHQAAQHLIGKHDFSSFRAAACQADSPIRTLKRLDVIETKHNLDFGRHVEIWAEARSFLHHQIRNIAGTLKLVGEGKWTTDDVKHALEAKDRTRGGPMAPASGLYFVRIDYPE